MKINRRNFLAAVGAGTLAAISAQGSGESHKRKNIIFIMADDASPDAFGCYGNRDVATPNIDRMAREGVMFRTAWASGICLPSRALVLTGRYAPKTGYYYNAFFVPQHGEDNQLFSHHYSFGKLLQRAGYKTAMAGKWHVGGAEKPTDPITGFDEYCLWEGTKELSQLPDKPEHTGAWEDRKTTARFWHPCVVKNFKYMETDPEDFGPDIFTDFVCDFVRRNRADPFLVFYSMVGPHITRKGYSTTPLRGKPGDIGSKHPEEEQAKFEALNEYIDVLVGRIIKQVKELGLLDDTLIVFTADNGTWPWGKARGIEHGCRVPFVAFGGGIKQRGATDELTDFSDIMPTLLDYAESDLPADYEVDGKSLRPFLSGKTDTHRDWIYSFIGATRLARNKNFMLEAENPVLGSPEGRFYYCGESRDGYGYKNVTDNPEYSADRKLFERKLAKYPPLTLANPVFKTRGGRKYLRRYKNEAALQAHLHSHPDHRRYDETPYEIQQSRVEDQ